MIRMHLETTSFQLPDCKIPTLKEKHFFFLSFSKIFWPQKFQYKNLSLGKFLSYEV